MIIQTCNKCFRNLLLSEFSTRKDFIKTIHQCKISYNKICKSCVKERKARWRAEHPCYMATYHKGRKEDPIKKICYNCGKEYTTNNPLQKYCATNCRHNTTEGEYKEWRKHYPHVSKEVFRRMILQKLKT
jgi:hypothetical protein